VRNETQTFIAVTPFAPVMPACPSTVPAPRTVLAGWPTGPAATARLVGAGYAAAKRRGVDRDVPSGTRFIGTNGTTEQYKQDQLHLMSRRDPRTWRPPA
jgi:hypothetical protein